MQHPIVTRAEIENIPEQVEDLDFYIKSFGKNWEKLRPVITQALYEYENGGITQETCTKGVAILKKIHALNDVTNGPRLYILHHCLQQMLPPGISEGNKC